MTDEEAQAIPARDITEREEAAVVALAVAAINEAETDFDAAEMLISAATMILIRERGPKATLEFIERIVAVQRHDFKAYLQ